MTESISINPKQTAIILIDLQKEVLGLPGAPYSSSAVLANAVQLAKKFRKKNALVVLVHVGTTANGNDMINVTTDTSLSGGERPDDWMELATEIGPKEHDVVITKRQWGGILWHRFGFTTAPKENRYLGAGWYCHKFWSGINRTRCL